MPDKKTSMVSVRLTDEEKRELEQLAERFEVSAGFMLRRMLRAGLREQGKHVLILSDDERHCQTR